MGASQFTTTRDVLPYLNVRVVWPFAAVNVDGVMIHDGLQWVLTFDGDSIGWHDYDRLKKMW